MQNPPLSELTIKTPNSKLTGTDSDDHPGNLRKRISLSLCEARKYNKDASSIGTLLQNVREIYNKARALKLKNTDPIIFRQTQVGSMASGSILTYQCALMLSTQFIAI